MPGVQGQISVDVSARQTGAADLGNPTVPVHASYARAFVPGTLAIDQADILWADERTLAASASESLDLAGVLSGLLGGTVTAAEITAIYVEAASANTNDVALFGAGANAFNGPLTGTTPKATLGPGDMILVTNRKGWTVNAGTADLLLVANSAGSSAVTYKIILIGRTVAA